MYVFRIRIEVCLTNVEIFFLEIQQSLKLENSRASSIKKCLSLTQLTTVVVKTKCLNNERLLNCIEKFI